MGDERARGQTSTQFIDPSAHEDEDDDEYDNADEEEWGHFFDSGVRPDDVLDGLEEGKTRRREEDGHF